MKNYLIVGASSGIGKAVAEELAINGERVFGTFNTHKVDDGGGISYHHLNVLEANPDLQFLPEALDGVAYCPGSITLKPFPRLTPDDFARDYDLQVIGAVKILQHVLPRLKKSSQASVVLYSTVAVQTGFNFHSLVASSKGAIEGLTRALAAEYAPAIRVNCIAPSVTDTPLAASLLNTEEKKQANALRHPLKKIGTPSDIASLTHFLLSDRSAWMTGQVLHLDGGMSHVRTFS